MFIKYVAPIGLPNDIIIIMGDSGYIKDNKYPYSFFMLKKSLIQVVVEQFFEKMANELIASRVHYIFF